MKLYRFNPNTLVHPTGGFEDSPIWHDNSYVSMTDRCVEVFKAAQTEGCEFNLVTEASEFTAVKLTSKPVARIRNTISSAIRSKYSIDDELRAHRVGDKEVLDDIDAIIKAKKAEVTALGFPA